MPLWNMRFEYDSIDKGGDLDPQLADTPEEAIAKTFNSQWDMCKTTHDANQSCFHFRMKDAHVTVYVWEDQDS